MKNFAFVLIVLILAGGAVYYFSSNVKIKEGLPVEQSVNNEQKICFDDGCLLAALKSCSAVEFSQNEGGVMVHYEVLGPDAENCRLSREFVSADRQSMREFCEQYPELKNNCLANLDAMLTEVQSIVGIMDICLLPRDDINQVGSFVQLTDIFGVTCESEL